MINPTGNDDEVAWGNLDANPFVSIIPHIEIAGAFQNESDFLIRMEMFLIENFQLFLVILQTGFGAGDFVFVTVASFLLDFF